MSKKTYVVEVKRLTDKELHEEITCDTLEEVDAEVSKLVLQYSIYEIAIHEVVYTRKIIREIDIFNRK